MLADPPSLNSEPKPNAERVIQVLVLDDNPGDIEFVSHCIARIEPWTVEVTGCGSLEAALSLAPQRDYELLFVDYWLGSTTGLEALAELRLAGLEAPAILMTGTRSEDVIVEALQAGVVDYIPKDALGPDALQRATRNAVEKADLSRAVRQKHFALVDSVQRLQERQEEIESFYHNVSHELKTPLTAAREFVSLVADEVVGPVVDEQMELLQATLHKCDQMAVCVNDMLDATRLDTGKFSLVIETVDLCAIVDDVVMSLRPRAAALEVRITAETPSQEMLLDVDAHRIFQVLSNLVGNAIKFSPKGATVRIAVELTSNDSVRVQVIDSGCGLAPEDHERVFDRLYQSSTEDAATLGGLGLGLYICRQIIELHAGEIFASGEVGVGSTFTFSLPRRKPVASSPSAT